MQLKCQSVIETYDHNSQSSGTCQNNKGEEASPTVISLAFKKYENLPLAAYMKTSQESGI